MKTKFGNVAKRVKGKEIKKIDLEFYNNNKDE
jgi:hypothetical protein